MPEPWLTDLLAGLPEPVRTLFKLGEVPWPGDAADWPDYAAKGLGPEHAGALAALIDEDAFDRLPFEDEKGRGVPTGWAELHVPRALVAVAGAGAIPALLVGARRCVEDDAFGDFYTAELERWLDACGEPGVRACAQLVGRPGNTWLEEAELLACVERWLKANPGPDAEMLLARVVRLLEGALHDTGAVDTEPNAFRIDFLAELRVASALPAIEAAWAEGGFDLLVCGKFTDVVARLEGRDPTPAPKPPPAAPKPGPVAAAARARKKAARKRKKR